MRGVDCAADVVGDPSGRSAMRQNAGRMCYASAKGEAKSAGQAAVVSAVNGVLMWLRAALMRNRGRSLKLFVERCGEARFGRVLGFILGDFILGILVASKSGMANGWKERRGGMCPPRSLGGSVRLLFPVSQKRCRHVNGKRQETGAD
ncbi:uncharacterized protein SPSK_04624 [Sporothrix schenckii 1099-18]|uniref:Uncharacterized protein n=1 Tax=Sporothrix schenckii 1099-18 TaxID=1397361 RepID=A0A0F2LZT2_SPOSC|nr:uncharacterized protein SPSK_04624 [Sporothrix schenckii 1099-18]KJR82958.1 hypothetical protein SPSK_04624 [Sporothrix schenckii 1099-18]